MKNNNQRGNQKSDYRGATVGDFLAPDQLASIKQFAQGPVTLEGKLKLFKQLSVEHEVVSHGRKDKRSRLGSFVNKMFNTQLALPSTGRRQQIGKAIKFGQEYLIENPTVSVYYAAAMGAAIEYREWMTLVGDLKPEQQLAILNQDATETPANS